MGAHEKTYFEQQREALIGEIAMASYPLTRHYKTAIDSQSAEL